MKILDEVETRVMDILLDDLRAYLDDGAIEPTTMIPVLVKGIGVLAGQTSDPNRALDEAQELLEGVTL